MNSEQLLSLERGDLRRESIASALRSRYPDLVIKRKGAASVEETLAVQAPGSHELTEEPEFEDIEDFLADHAGLETLHEQDVAEVLAASWREKRQQLNKLQDSKRPGSSERPRMFVARFEWRLRS